MLNNKKKCPLSITQDNIWRQQFQWGFSNTLFNNGIFLELKGEITPNILENGIKKAINRHKIITAIIRKGEDQPFLEYLNNPENLISHIDLSMKTEPFAEAYDFAKEETKEPYKSIYDTAVSHFDILKLSSNHYAIYGKFHQIIADGQSVIFFVNELIAIYNNLLKDSSEPMPDAIGYDVFVDFQKKYILSEQHQKDLAFFDDYYQKNTPYIFKKTPKPQKILAENLIENILNQKTYLALNDICLRYHLSFNCVLIATLYLAIKIIYQAEAFGLSYLTMNRRKKEHKKIFGSMSDAFTIKADWNQETDIISLAKKIRGETLSFSRHTTCPSNLAYKNVFNRFGFIPKYAEFSINQINAPIESKNPDLKVQLHYIPNDYIISPCNITFYNTFEAGKSFVRLEYMPDVLSKQEAKVISSLFLDILEIYSQDNEKTVANIITKMGEKHKDEIEKAHKENISAKIILSNEEKKRLIAKGKAPKTELPKHPNLFAYIEDINKNNLEETAVISSVNNDIAISYSSLFKMANNIAFNLISNGFKKGDVVAVMLEKDEFVPIAFLAILKAGGAYLPIDIRHPTERIDYMLKNAGVKLCITNDLSEKICPIEGYIKLNVNKIDFSNNDIPEIKCPAKMSDTAYILYTSGSTGVPKGAIITHENIIKTIPAIIKNFAFNKNPICLSVGSYAFDAFGLDFYTSLFKSGTLIIIPNFIAMSGRDLIDKFNKYDPDMFFSGPVICRLLLASNWQGSKKIDLTTGGENLTGELARKILPLVKNIWNIYGPTEATIGVTANRTTQEDTKQTSVPIGKPIDNAEFIVVDENLELVPDGKIGELLIGGEVVSRGYFNNEKLTKERFITLPYAKGIFYRTGDLVFWNDDDKLVFVGRNDFQVKVRGYRIEIEEIEQKIEEIAEVEQAIVTIHNGQNGEKDLCAWIKTNENLNITDINQKLSSKIPHFMLPKYVKMLNLFPLTITGKIDRQKLSQTPTKDLISNNQFEQNNFTTNIEAELAKIWSEIIGTTITSAQSNFFEVGGNSLQATSLVQRIKERFDVELSISSIFEKPILEDTAKTIASVKDNNGNNEHNLSKTIRNIMASSLAISPQNISETISFFDLGGDSLTLVTFLENINQEFKTNIKVSDFFDKPSINGLIELILKQAMP